MELDLENLWLAIALTAARQLNLKPRRQDFKAERDEEIARLYATGGGNLTTIADEFGLTRERIRQIVVRAGIYRRFCTECGKRRVSPPRRKCAYCERRAKDRRCVVCGKRCLSNNYKYCQAHMHGHAHTYRSAGCRCELCKAANAEVTKRLLGRVPPVHGRSGYSNYGCRCDICRAAGAAANRAETLRRKQRIAEGYYANGNGRFKHGIGGYANYFCRCEICTTAATEARKKTRRELLHGGSDRGTVGTVGLV